MAPKKPLQDMEELKESILLPYELEVVEHLRKLEAYIKGKYMEEKNSFDQKSLPSGKEIKIEIEIENDLDKETPYKNIVNMVRAYCVNLDAIIKDFEILLLILARILHFDRKDLWEKINNFVNDRKSDSKIEQPFYEFRWENSKLYLVIKDYVAIPKDFVAAYFGYDSGIDGLNLLMNGGFLLPPDRSTYISISGEAGIGKTSLAIKLVTAFFQNYRFKNVYCKEKKLVSDNAELLEIHYILLEQKKNNIVRLIKECKLINKKNKNVISILGENNTDEPLTEDDIDKIIKFEDNVLFSPMSLIEKIEEIENSKKKEKSAGKRKVIVIDSVNAIQEMDISRSEWRELFQGIKAITMERNTIVIFVGEKDPQQPDSIIEYLSDVVFKLYKDYRQVSFSRVIELAKSRFQKFHHGKHIFYLTKHDSGFIRIYPSSTALSDMIPPRKRVHPPKSDITQNKREVGIKIDGIINFFKYSHLYSAKMEPFFLKNSISMFTGDRGTHKSAFAKKFALSAFRDERWETSSGTLMEFDYREREADKPWEEIWNLGFWNARPKEKAIALLLNFSENYDEDPENDIIWETYFGKIIIPGCKTLQRAYIGYISHIVCYYEVKDLTEDVYLYQLEELIRTIESYKVIDHIPDSYSEFVNRRSLSLQNRKVDDKAKNKEVDEVAKDKSNVYFNPYNCIYKEDFVRNLKSTDDELDKILEHEMHIKGFKKIDLKDVEASTINIKDLIIEEIEKFTDKIKKTGKTHKLNVDVMHNLKKELSNEDFLKSKGDFSKLNEYFNGIIDTREKIKKINWVDEDNSINKIDFLIRMLFSINKKYDFAKIEEPNLFKLNQVAQKMFCKELLNLKGLVKDDKFVDERECLDYKYVKKIKVSRIILDDAENLENVYTTLDPRKYISTLAHICMAREITLGIINTRSKERTSIVDTVCNSVSDNVFKFDKYFFKGELFTTFSIIRSATNYHNNMLYYISKRDDGLLQLKNTFALLSNVEKQNPEPICIRLFLPDLSIEFSKTMYRLLVDRDLYLASLPLGNIITKPKGIAKSINFASEFKIKYEKSGLETTYKPYHKFPSIYKDWHEFIKDTITYSLAHPNVEIHTANDPFADISIILEDESAKDAITILCLPGYIMDLYEKNLATISDYIHFPGEIDNTVMVNTNNNNNNKGDWITGFFLSEEKGDRNQIKFGNDFYYLKKSVISIANPNNGKQKEYNHTWIVPEILFNPVIARDDRDGDGRIIRKRNNFNNTNYIDIKGYPYYIDPRVNLIFSINEKASEIKEIPPDFTIHNNSHDFVALFFELWFKMILFSSDDKYKNGCKTAKKNEICKKSTGASVCMEACNFCFFEQTLRAQNGNSSAKELIEKIVEQFIEQVKKIIEFNKDGLIKRLINLGEVGNQKEIVLREWYSSAQQKLKILEPILYNCGKPLHVRMEVPDLFLYTTFFLAIPVNSPRKETASEIIINITTPHDLAYHQISGIGLQLSKRFYDENMDKFYPRYNYQDCLKAMENLLEPKDIIGTANPIRLGIPLDAINCYLEHLTILGGILFDFYRYYRNLIMGNKNGSNNLPKGDAEQLTKKLIAFGSKFKYWQRDHEKRCGSCYMAHLLDEYIKNRPSTDPQDQT